MIPEVWKSEILVAREVPNQGTCALQRFAFTVGLLTKVSFDGLSYEYSARYCYPLKHDAEDALEIWDGVGDPPGNWVKEKLSERNNPAYDPTL